MLSLNVPALARAVLSRLALLWAVCAVVPEAAGSPWAALMVASWALVEVPRYLFYVLETLGQKAPYALTWVRYSLFLVLYPTGITGEVGSLVTALPFIKERGVLTATMPNAHNFAWNHWAVMAAALALYVPGSPTMIGHMWKQRVKKLAEARGEPKAAKGSKAE